MRKLMLLCWVIVAFAVSGCGSKSSETALDTNSGSEQYDSSGSDSASALLEEARRMVKDVFFQYDSAELEPAAVSQLKNNAEWLNQNRTISAMIEGHCDERGTSEYNMALGEKRAETTKSFLVRAGVAASRLETVSFGEERPFDSGHTEAAWSKNRRAHFVVK